MKQILSIHGGTTYARYEDFLHDLATKKITVERLKYAPRWRELLQQSLGTDYEVLLASMPNSSNARYTEWALCFESLIKVLENDVILIGHSLGAAFLAKYLSEHTLPVTIKATVLVAAPYDDESIEDLTEFKLDGITDTFRNQAGRVVFFFGEDDPSIPVSEMEKYKQALPGAEFHLLPAPDHFVRSDFPEIIQTIKSL